MRLIALFGLLLSIASCGSNNESEASGLKKDSVWMIETTGATIMAEPGIDSTDQKWSLTSSYTAEVFETPDLGWGYKIFTDGALFINQPHIPAIQGNKGFSSKEKAMITADFAILKMEQGFVPPTISQDELDSLGVLD